MTIEQLQHQLSMMMDRLNGWRAMVNWYQVEMDGGQKRVSVRGGYKGKRIVVTWIKDEWYHYSWDGKRMGNFRVLRELMDDWEGRVTERDVL